MGKRHRYEVKLTWTGNASGGATSPRSDRRDYTVQSGNKPAVAGSSDAVFGGDPARWNPEDLLVASLSACHQLWYLGLAARAGLQILAYEDEADGFMVETILGGAGAFEVVTLRPCVALPHGADEKLASALHETAHQNCFIARSVNFAVIVEPSFRFAGPDLPT